MLDYVMPNVGIGVVLPTSNWNGKLLQVGCGGYCGIAPEVLLVGCRDALARGYACTVSDMGHSSTGADGKWAYNNLQAEVDFGYRATHVAVVAAKAITDAFYAKAPERAYYMGCSTGGRQGLVEAQRFPWDFDGIISGSVNIGMEDELMALLWDARALRGADGKLVLAPDDLRHVHEAALAVCDMDDGLKDGIISNPRSCAFDPAKLLCIEGDRGTCLTAPQVDALKKIYAGPQTSKGIKISTGGPMPGSELSWIEWFFPNAYSEAISPSKESMIEIFTREWFRYQAFMPDPGASWKLADFDFDRDYKRFGLMESLLSNQNPDLRKFKGAGGKLIVYGGWNDPDATPLGTIDYYETAVNTMGGRAATEQFFRFFLVPGMGHCGSGDGPFSVDYLRYLEAWVEQ
ncbi:MAG: tannase/feruloyl esterase family alpha/beta hydrolase, partial [Gemmatimonadota bacterium]